MKPLLKARNHFPEVTIIEMKVNQESVQCHIPMLDLV